MNAKLFTVEIGIVDAQDVEGRQFRFYECWFLDIHFIREKESDVKHWVRVAARNVCGKNTKIIFIHKEGQAQ